MASMCAATAAGAIGLLGYTAYHFYKPVPQGMAKADQWILRIMHVFMKIISFVAQIGHMIGYDNNINLHRRMMTKRLEKKHRSSNVQSVQHTFDGVPVFVYTKKSWNSAPEKPKSRPAIYYIHGGGWVFGHSAMYAALERRFVRELDVVLVSVDYRLAPEHPYPAGLNDCLTALQYLHQHSGEFGVDPDRITIAGDSAGGNMAAAITLKLRDEGQNWLYRQVLLSPATQIVSCLSKSIADNRKFAISFGVDFYHVFLDLAVGKDYKTVFLANGHVSERIIQHKAWPYLHKYHRDPDFEIVRNEEMALELEEKLMDPQRWPMMADSLAGLPPALVLVSEFDAIRDDSLAYADRLQAEGTDTVVARSHGFHGAYGFFTRSPSGEEMVKTVIHYLRDAYHDTS